MKVGILASGGLGFSILCKISQKYELSFVILIVYLFLLEILGKVNLMIFYQEFHVMF